MRKKGCGKQEKQLKLSFQVEILFDMLVCGGAILLSCLPAGDLRIHSRI